MVLAEAILLFHVYKEIRTAHTFLKEFNERVLRSAKLKGVLEITKEDVQNLQNQLAALERVQESIADERRWRLRQRDAITARRDATSDGAERARWQTDLDVLAQKLAALESTAAALNKKEATLHNLDALLRKAETLGVERADKLRKKGHIPISELESLGVDVAAESKKLDEEHAATQNVLTWLEKETKTASPARA